jgi:tetratricopeptide (TPR) repeat protein
MISPQSFGSDQDPHLARLLQRALEYEGRGALGQAAELYQTARAMDPHNSNVLERLALVRVRQGKLDEAIGFLREALELRPDSASAHFHLGNVLYSLGHPEKAKTSYETAIALVPDFADAHYNLATTLQTLGRYDEARVRYEQALPLMPDRPEVYNNLAIVLQTIGDHEQAIGHFEKAVALKPDYPEAYNNLANSLYALNRCEEAVRQYQRALALKADFAEAHDNLGMAHVAVGRITEARQCFETAIALAPERGSFHFNLTKCKTFGPNDPDLRAMEALATKAASLPADERVKLHFALGNALADVAQHERSFEHFRLGNALMRQQLVYDEEKSLARIDRVRTVFTPELMRAKAGLGDPSSVPVFILGMPRSGSTLVEQILASHPDVFAAGELDDFYRLVRSVRRSDGARIDYPERVPELSGAVLRAIGAGYVDRLRRRAPAAGRITDKMPTNWWLTGLIHLVLPNARIIHTRRNAVDTCVSCFTTLFHGQDWSYELGELARYYRTYAATMAHWRAVLPQGVMLEIDYEHVVADVEGQARRILAHCGLDWNEACLDFHRVRRPVKTASAAEVHRPIYQSSVGRWRRYGESLRPTELW